MTSLHKYAARRHTAFYYAPPGVDPTVPTGTPLPEPLPEPAERATDDLAQDSMEDHIIEPMGFVADVAREYARIRNEMGPKPQAAPVLDEKALRRKRKQEKAEEDRRARAIACVQYQKLLDQKAYVNAVYQQMEEMGYFDEVQTLDDEDAEAGDTENEDDDDMDEDEDGDEQDILEDCGYETVDVGETYLDLEEVGRRRARDAGRALNARYFSNEFVQGSSRT